MYLSSVPNSPLPWVVYVVKGTSHLCVADSCSVLVTRCEPDEVPYFLTEPTLGESFHLAAEILSLISTACVLSRVPISPGSLEEHKTGALNPHSPLGSVLPLGAQMSFTRCLRCLGVKSPHAGPRAGRL